ncbi:nuclear transport factor 2 family protein [Streptomyces prasinus]|uniref:Nuclear transport factor 2 family protein n=3 Tax=Streptomyces prasinus TaxID=67345 RepID=A0ABX6ASL8_9ACTN|nr:nuclear transport factor 2 family protein [Streptomyces prasinus]
MVCLAPVLESKTRKGKGMNLSDRKKLVLRYYELIDAGSYDELFEMFDEDVVYERAGTRSITGKEEFQAFYMKDRRIAEGRHSVTTVVSDGDWVVARGTFEGVLKSGEEVSVTWADFHRFRKGKIWRRYTYFGDRPI